jgi:hypothetical protein
MAYRWFGFLILRRAYRVLFADDPRPVSQRLTHEAKRLLIAAAVIVTALFVLVVAIIATAIAHLS